MTHRDTVRQDRLIKADLEWLARVQGDSKLQKKHAKMVKQEMRLERANYLKNLYGESSTRVLLG